ncbi:MAG: hypothetical protein F4Z18_08330 [Caldilineaceae bacterium SB0666_bin_21]|nr:hypothetical protein [Caldilineaceae bacterium SB0666_bin_21]
MGNQRQPFSEQYEKDGYTVHLTLSYTGKMDDSPSIQAVCKSKCVEFTARGYLSVNDEGMWKRGWGKTFETAEQGIQWLMDEVVSNAKRQDERHTNKGAAYVDAQTVLVSLLEDQDDEG